MGRERFTATQVACAGIALMLAAGLVAMPVPTVGVILLAVASIVLIRSPDLALVAFFALVPFHFLGFELATAKLGAHLGPVVYWKEALLVGLLIRGVQRRLSDGGGPRLPEAAGDRLLLGYVLVLVLWATMSPFIQPAFNSFVRTAEGPVMVLTILALSPSRRIIKWCLVAMLCGGVVMATGGLVEQGFRGTFQSWYGFNTSSEVFYVHPLIHSGYRSGSFFGDSLELGFYLAGLTTMALAAVLMTRARLRLLAVAAVGLFVGGTVVTYTRSAYVALPLGALVTLALGIQRRVTRRAAFGFTVVAVVLLGALFAARGAERFSHAGDNSVHFALLRSAFDQSVRHPLGFGLGTTDFVAHRYNIEGYVGQSVDSVYGDRLVEGGVVVLTLYLLALFVTGSRLVSARVAALRAVDREAAILAAGALGAFIAVAAAGVFLPVQEQPVTMVAWGSTGLALAAVRARSSQSTGSSAAAASGGLLIPPSGRRQTAPSGAG